MRALPLILLLACKGPDAVPDDLDSLLHFLWLHYDDGPEVMAEFLDHLDTAVDGEHLDGPVRGVVSDMGAEEVALLPMSHDPDPEAANGMVLVNHLACRHADLVPVVTALDQDAKYPGSYDVYERVYTSSHELFLQGAQSSLTWTTHYETSNLLTGPFSSNLSGGVRQLVDLDGPVLLQRSWLSEPAEFQSENRSFDQDFQVEVYWERAPGEMNHVIAMWRQMDLGGVTTDDDLYVNTALKALEDWDEQTGKLCRGEG
jgi:hypothetical protein